MKLSYAKFIVVFSVGWIAALICGISSAGSEGGSKNLLVEQVSNIEPDELWHSREVQIYRSSDGLVVGFWPMDAESAPVKNGKRLVGFAMAGLGDIAERPAVIKVWGTRMVFADEVTASFVKRKERVTLFFLPEQCVSADKCPDGMAALSMRADAHTATVYVNDKAVGVIREP